MAVRVHTLKIEKDYADSVYFGGRVDGMEYVVDALQEALQGKENE